MNYDLTGAVLENALAAAGITARVWEVDIRNPRWARFVCTVAAGTRVARVAGLEDELAMAVGVDTVRIWRDAGALNIDVPRTAARAVALPDLLRELPAVPPNAALLGLDDAGGPLMLKLDSPDVAHALLAGTTGSGKTALLRTMLLSLALFNPPGRLQLALIDPKRANLAPLSGLPHVWGGGLAADTSAAADLIVALVREMERRGVSSLPRIVLALDELADLAVAAPQVLAPLSRLVQRGRECGIHVLAATQRPAAAQVGGLLKANFPTRLVGRVTSAEESKLASGLPGMGAERLLGRGDFLLLAAGQTIRFQAAYAGPGEQERVLSAIVAGARHRRTPGALPAAGRAPAERVIETPPVATGATSGASLVLASEAVASENTPVPPVDEAGRIRQLARAGYSRNRISAEVFGHKDSRTLATITAVLGPIGG